MSRLQGKIVIVTGAGAGQGAEEARLLCSLGAKVVATDIDRSSVEAVVDGINARSPGQAVAMMHDVASSADWTRVVAETGRRFGSVNVLVNNAGVLTRTPFEEVTLEDWQAVMNVNAWGVFAGIQAVVPAMRDAGVGSIVNIASIAATTSIGGLSAYTASKGAVDALTRGAAAVLGQWNIRVNCVHPGIIQTAMMSFTTDAARAAAASTLPIGRLGRPVDVAQLVAHLASDESCFTTGSSYTIDGGASIEGGLAWLREKVAAVL